MEIKEFQLKSTRTLNQALPKDMNIVNMCLGAYGEFSEVSELIKKHVFQGHELNREKVKEELGDTLKYLLDNMVVKVLSYKGKVFGIEPPMFVELEVTYTEPGFKGNTSTGTLKPATLETGYNVNVPLFVEIGDKVRIDTRSGEYMERV